MGFVDQLDLIADSKLYSSKIQHLELGATVILTQSLGFLDEAVKQWVSAAKRQTDAMDNGTIQETQVPPGILTGITFGILRETDAEKLSVLLIDGPNEVTDPRLGLPNPTSECPTCGSKAKKQCEGHFGYVKLHNRVLHPYFITEAINILNKICPWCKSSRQHSRRKAASLLEMLNACKYCHGKTYPSVRFRITSNELFRNSGIVVEVVEKSPNRNFEPILPDDYWDFIPKEMGQLETGNKATRRDLTPNQIYGILKKINPKLFKSSISSPEELFLRNFLITPNFHRLTEFMHPMSNGQKLDDRTRAAKKLAGFKGSSSDLVSRFMDYIKLSKLHLGKQANEFTLLANKDVAFSASSSKWMKEVILTKRSDHIFRTVITGDPNLKLNEVSDHLNLWNWEKLSEVCNSILFEKGDLFIRRNEELVRITDVEKLQIGDLIYRPLVDGDIVLMNRPPSIHQHSLLGLNARIMSAEDPKMNPSTKSDVSVDFVVTINPLICAPLYGDFDGDCIHGFIPQSVESRTELIELVALDKQLTNGQSGKNLLSLTHDSLTAAHLLVEEGCFLGTFQMQQLEMLSLRKSDTPAILKSPSTKSPLCTGKQLFSMLLPADFDFEFSSYTNSVQISKGEIVSSSSGSSWLRGDSDGNLFEALIKHCNGKSLEYLHSAQQVLCEWLSLRGLSVSLFDLYLCSDKLSHKNMIDEVNCGLQEAEITCQVKQLMVESLVDYLTLAAYENQSVDENIILEVEKMCYQKQKSAALCRVSVSAFKQVYRDIQNLIYQYAGKENSLLSIVKAGSRSSLAKIVQQAMSLGLQHSMVPLSFKLPHKLSCEAWNNSKAHGSSFRNQDALDCSKSYIPYAVVESSFLAGLNPLECFVHSVTSRDSSFRENADVPGTLNRRLMFFMRDMHSAYDGTVRSVYGNQLFQFSYDTKGTSLSYDPDSWTEDTDDCNAFGGQPVGSLAACAISEAAYSALDQPISVLEPSPLFNLKKVLESGLKRSNTNKTATLYLSSKLKRIRHGFEYAALEVKNHLEGLLFKDIVSSVMIVHSSEPSSQALCPWVCHFYICKDMVKRRRLKLHSLVDALHKKCLSAFLPKLQITVKNCMINDMGKDKKATFCLTASFIETPTLNHITLDMVRDVLMPDLLQSVIKGRMEFKKVDILWSDQSDEPKAPKSRIPSGELYLKVFLSTNCRATRLWNLLMENCLPIMELIDWTRSYPDDMHDMFVQYGIDVSWRCFLGNLKSAVNDVGKSVLPQHLMLVADCLSVTGEFVGLSAKGMARQRTKMSVSSPFMQACFSSPGVSFIKSAKAGAVDPLQGSLDSLAWGKVPPLGTGASFEIVYNSKEHEVEKPTDIYSLLTCNKSFHLRNTKQKVPDGFELVKDKSGAMRLKELPSRERFRNLGISKSLLEAQITLNDIKKLSHTLRGMLNKYSIDEELDEVDKKMLKTALHFHPRSKEKIGPGVVGHHPVYGDARCFLLQRKDGSIEDFSYHKCVHGALEMFAPNKAKNYKSRWLKKDIINEDNMFRTEPAVACW
ncbi:hypothetical protein V2J09_022434 [Rumex salicifolius]